MPPHKIRQELLTLDEAAEVIRQYNITLLPADLSRHALHGDLPLSVYFPSPAQPAFGSGRIAPGTMLAVHYSYCRLRQQHLSADPGRAYGQNCAPENQNSLVRVILVGSSHIPPVMVFAVQGHMLF